MVGTPPDRPTCCCFVTLSNYKGIVRQRHTQLPVHRSRHYPSPQPSALRSCPEMLHSKILFLFKCTAAATGTGSCGHPIDICRCVLAVPVSVGPPVELPAVSCSHPGTHTQAHTQAHTGELELPHMCAKYTCV